MKIFFLLPVLAILSIPSAYAQQAVAVKSNIEAIDKHAIVNHFEIPKKNEKTGAIEHINVNYSVSPAPFSQFIRLDLNTPHPTRFTAEVIDTKGQQLLQWTPKDKNHIYSEQFNTSNWPPADYTLKISSELNPEFVYSITIHKS